MLDGLAHGSRSSMSGSRLAYTVSPLFQQCACHYDVHKNVLYMIIWWKMIFFELPVTTDVWWFSKTGIVLTLRSLLLQFGGWSPQSYWGINLSMMKASCHIGPQYSLPHRPKYREHEFCNSLILSCWYIQVKGNLHAPFFKFLQLYIQIIQNRAEILVHLCICGNVAPQIYVGHRLHFYVGHRLHF
jgi:hypothetical protein